MPRYSLFSYYFWKYCLGLIELVDQWFIFSPSDIIFSINIFSCPHPFSLFATLSAGRRTAWYFPTSHCLVRIPLQTLYLSSLRSSSCLHMHSLVLSERLRGPLGTALEPLLCVNSLLCSTLSCKLQPLQQRWSPISPFSSARPSHSAPWSGKCLQKESYDYCVAHLEISLLLGTITLTACCLISEKITPRPHYIGVCSQ